MDFKTISLRPRTIENYSESDFQHLNWHLCWEEQTNILLSNWSGIYRIGSDGNPDAGLILKVLKLAIKKWKPEKLIVDFSDLSYQWGNTMWNIFSLIFNFKHPTASFFTDFSKIYDPDGSSAVIVGEKALVGLKTLLKVDYSKEPFFNNLNTAYTYITKSR